MSIYDTLSLYIFVDYCFRIMSSLFQQTTSLSSVEIVQQ